MALVDELERLGHVVRDAQDGAVALALLDSFTPDVVVTDLMMPKVDGAGLIRGLRGRPGPPIPVVLITGVPEGQAAGRPHLRRLPRQADRLPAPGPHDRRVHGRAVASAVTLECALHRGQFT